MSALVSMIDTSRTQSNLSSAVRVFLFHHFRPQADAGKGPTGGRTRRIDLRKSLAQQVPQLRHRAREGRGVGLKAIGSPASFRWDKAERS
jgi:hypothetical protein